MHIEIPKIEPREFDDLLKEFKALVPFYTPGWRYGEKGKCTDNALVNIFIHFLGTIYHRLNHLPEKHFISFLDRIGIKLIPAQPAVAPITFVLSEGAAEHVLVPAGTQVAAGEVIFETEKNLLAAPARLVALYSTDGKQDAIFPCPPNIIAAQTATPVDTRLLYPAQYGAADIFVESFEDLAAGDIIRIGDSPGDPEDAIVAAVEETRVSLVHPLQKSEPGYYRFPAIAVRGVGPTYYGRLKEKHKLAMQTVYTVKDQKLTETRRWDFTVKDLLQYQTQKNILAKLLSPDPRSFGYYLEQAENILENASKCVLDADYEAALEEAAASGDFPYLSPIHRETGEAVEKITYQESFTGKNLQEHIFYLGHSELFNLDCDALIVLRLAAPLPTGSADLCWEYWGDAVETMPPGKEEHIDWHPLDFQPGGLTDDGYYQYYLRKSITGEIKELTVKGIDSRWIRCRLKTIDTGKNIEIKNLRFRVVSIRFLELPCEAIRGIEDEFTRRLAEKNIYTTAQLLEFKDRVYDVARTITSTTRWRERAENIIENTSKHLLDKEYEDILVATGPSPEMLPGMACYNDQVLDLTAAADLSLEAPIYPFGRKPAQQDIFYIASKEIFSELETKIQVSFRFSSEYPGESNNARLAWEYWDGSAWSPIKNLKNTTGNFTESGAVTFLRPGDMAVNSVNGKENYWVRVRLVSGDYGQETLKEVTTTVISQLPNGGTKEQEVTVYTPDYSQVKPPLIEKLTLSYTHEFTPVFHTFERSLTLNNLEFSERTSETDDPAKSFKPFIPLEDQSRDVYLGFDKKLSRGPIALFFAIAETPVPPEQIPTIHWQYYHESLQWKKLQAIDGTMSLTRTGVIEFVFPLEFKATSRFGRSAYWIRAVYENQTASGSTQMAVPRITGIYLNTAQALQYETVKGEIAGSSDGTADQAFTLKKTPVIAGSEEVWVNEFKAISAEEQARIREELYAFETVSDDKGNISEFWIKWEPAASILEAAAGDRCYELDNVTGEIMFGDGIYGKIPPTGADNIKVNYRSGGGVKGNVSALLVKDLKTSLPFVDKAYNPLAAGGGADSETVERMMDRGPQVLRHRNRAITVEDFEHLTFLASVNIARVKCLADTDQLLEPRDGYVTVIAIPQSDEEKPLLSLQLKQKLENYLRARAAYVIVEKKQLNVLGPIYVEVSVEAQVAAETIDVVPLVENDCDTQLKAFLNPLGGGGEQKGWEFGKAPCFSDFYALLEAVEGVDHVEDLAVTYKILGQAQEKSASPELFTMPSYAIVCSGEHKIKVTL